MSGSHSLQRKCYVSTKWTMIWCSCECWTENLRFAYILYMWKSFLMMHKTEWGSLWPNTQFSTPWLHWSVSKMKLRTVTVWKLENKLIKKYMKYKQHTCPLVPHVNLYLCCLEKKMWQVTKPSTSSFKAKKFALMENRSLSFKCAHSALQRDLKEASYKCETWVKEEMFTFWWENWQVQRLGKLDSFFAETLDNLTAQNKIKFKSHDSRKNCVLQLCKNCKMSKRHFRRVIFDLFICWLMFLLQCMHEL